VGQYVRSIIASFICALLITACLTPAVRKLALRLRVIDEPSARRVHARTIPRLGGLALVAGFFLPLIGILIFDAGMSELLFARPVLMIGIAAGAIVVVTLGAFDDVMGVSAKWKLAIQCAAGIASYAAGSQIHAIHIPGLGVVELGVFALPMTVLWIVGIVNAVNLIDGLDGLATGVAFFACVANFTVAALNGDVFTCLLAVTLGGALLGFLIHNFNPATIFMGDSGSMFLGFVLANMSLFGAGTYKGSTAIALVVPLLALGLPIMDMMVAMVRRFLAHRSIFSPDRGHIHHRLLDAGLTQRRAVLTLYGLCFVFTAGALAVHVGRSWQIGASLSVLAVSVVAVARFSGYFNRALHKQDSSSGAGSAEVLRLRRAVPQLMFRIRDVASDPKAVLALLQEFAREAEFLEVQLGPYSEATGRDWSWRAPGATPKQLREAVSAAFESQRPPAFPERPLAAPTLTFTWDSADGEVNPQCRILLQILVDQVEEIFEQHNRPSRLSGGLVEDRPSDDSSLTLTGSRLT
jgi:UDP-GlcNAc:undecaprenyl-phosphate GlcNAc-1-phosphate transferase